LATAPWVGSAAPPAVGLRIRIPAGHVRRQPCRRRSVGGATPRLANGPTRSLSAVGAGQRKDRQFRFAPMSEIIPNRRVARKGQDTRLPAVHVARPMQPVGRVRDPAYRLARAS